MLDARFPLPPKHFNTAGPCNPEWHYMLPAAERLEGALALIEQRAYFVVHAPRQTGKTTTLMAIAKELTAAGRYAALHFSCETAEPARDDFRAAERLVLASLRRAASNELPPELGPPPWPESEAGDAISAALKAWSCACPRPLVLFFDEIDALRGESLRSVLRQLRAGFPQRPAAFPQSVVLCGLRDVRDYRAASGGDPERLGTSSPFNVKVESLRIGDFRERDVDALLLQHTAETGQPFTEAARKRVFELGQGQPWLTNALAREVVEKLGLSKEDAIEVAHVEAAKERLILARQTHLDSLVSKLADPRVKRILQPIIAGTIPPMDVDSDDDCSYVRDLGLIAMRPLRFANPIYREVILRVLASPAENAVLADPRSFVTKEGRLDLRRLLEEFAAFWRKHGEIVEPGFTYREASGQLVLLAFLHRIVNGDGFVEREVGIGRGRIDVHVRWPIDVDGKRAWQEEAIELKARGPRDGDPLEEGLEQLDGYLTGLGLGEGWLVIFDRRPDAPPFKERTKFESAVTPGGRKVTVLRA